MARRLPYSEGDCFAVPLPGGFAIGIAARLGHRGAVLGYFFLSAPDGLAALRLERADLIAKFGDPNLLDGTWPVIGQLPSWDRTQWPMPVFWRQDGLGKLHWLVYHDDKLNFLREDRVSVGQTVGYPEDGAWGCDAVSGWLAKLAKDRGRQPLKQLPKLGPAIPTTSTKTTRRKVAAKTALP